MSVNNPIHQNKELLSVFWKLAEGDDNDRITSTRILLNILEEKQGKNTEVCLELDYSLNRLLQGLSSTRKWARLGFAMALTQVLRAYPLITIEDVLKRMSVKLRHLGSDTKVEQSNLFVGQMMAYLALIQANKFQESDEQYLKELTGGILAIRTKKLPLHHLCTQALVQLITKASAEQFSSVLFPLLEADLSGGWQQCSPDSLLLLLTAVKHQAEKINKPFLQEHWGSKTVISEKTLDAVSSVIMQSTPDHPIMHPICLEILNKAAKKPQLHETFWKNAMCTKVFSGGPNRRYLVFHMVPEALKLATTESEVYAILSPVLIHSVIKNLTCKDQVLFGASKQLVAALIHVSEKATDASIQVAILKSLVTSPGTVLLDSVVKTKVVGAVLGNLSPEAAKLFSKTLIDNVLGEEITRPYSEADLAHKKAVDLVTQQKWSVNTLSVLISPAMVTAQPEWCHDVLEFLFKMAYFDTSGGLKQRAIHVDQSVRQILSTSFFRVLDKVAKYLGKGTKGFLAYNDILHHMVVFAQSLLEKDDLTPTKKLDQPVLEAWQNMYNVIEKIRKKREKSSSVQNADLAFELMFLHHGLQLLSDAKPAMEVLEELHTCYDKSSQKKRRQSVLKKPSDEDEPEWVDVVVDLLMSLLSQPSHLVRTVVSTVFTMFCPHLTRDSLQLILEVLKPVDEAQENPLEFKDEDMDVDDEEEEEGEDEASEEDAGSNSEEESSEGEDEEEEKDEGDDSQVDEKLRKSLQSALGKAADLNDDEESSSDEDFDDETMMRLDNKLAAVFQNMRKSRKKTAEEEMQLVHYKMRCLDLVEILIAHTSSASLLLDLVYPLLTLIKRGIREKSQKSLGDRASKVFHKLTSGKKVTIDPHLKQTELTDKFNSLMEFSTKIGMIPLIRELGKAAIFVIHIMLGGTQMTGPSPVKTRSMRAAKQKQKEPANDNNTNIDSILEIVEDKLKEFFEKRDTPLHPIFFQTMLELEPGLFWSLSTQLFDHIADAKLRIFCRTRACLMLSALVAKTTVNQLEPEVWTNFAEKTVSMIQEALDTGSKQTFRPRFLQELLCLLHKTLSVMDKDLRTTLLTEDLVELLKRVKPSGNQDSRQAINRVIGLYGGTHTGLKKSKKKKNKRKSAGEASEMETDAVTEQSAEQHQNGSLSSPEHASSTQTSTPAQSGKKKRKEIQVTNTNGDLSDDVSTPKSKKKKTKKTPKSEVKHADVEASEEVDDVRKNLDSLLLDAKSPKNKRRKSELPPSINDGSAKIKSAKKKRKSMGDAL